MRYGYAPEGRRCIASHVQWTGENRFLSPPEVEAVIRHAEAQPLRRGTIGNGDTNQGHEDLGYRCVETCAIEGLDWLYERILEKTRLANAEHFFQDISGIVEPVGYLRYTPAEGETPAGHYNWHQDFGGGGYATRKLTLIVQLSNADEYTGCELQYVTNGIWTMPYKQAGDAFMFPSWTPHRVTPIESGVRRSLVVWIAGPPVR